MPLPQPTDPLAGLEAEIQATLAKVGALASIADLEALEMKVLGRHGSFSRRFAALGVLPPDQRKFTGDRLNEAKRRLQGAIDAHRSRVAVPTSGQQFSLPAELPRRGHLHPLTQFSRRMFEVWRSLGFDIHEGPELEDQWFNFEGLNMPPDHPARDIQDTFYIKKHPELVLRTHCSTVQLRSVLHQEPPLKYVEIGRVYRHEATDATHESMFSHCDGIVIDRHLTMANLVTTLKVFLGRLFPGAELRVRPSYFPFVEPGIEIDMRWERNGKKEWLEMIGAGMVHPNVLQAMKLSPDEWTGFAFGIGVERLAMIEYGIPDIRLLFNGRLDFLQQF